MTFQSTQKPKWTMEKTSLNLNPNIEHDEYWIREHEIYKTKIQTNFYSKKAWKYEYEVKWTKLWCKVIP